MAYVQVNNASHALKLAAFIVAFFSSFFSVADIFTDGTVVTVPPKDIIQTSINCSGGGEVSSISAEGHSFTNKELSGLCYSSIQTKIVNKDTYNFCPGKKTNKVEGTSVYLLEVKYYPRFSNGACSTAYATDRNRITGGATGVVEAQICPPDIAPLAISSTEINGQKRCYNPDDIPTDEEDEEKEKECKGLVLDSGNNTAPDMCYTSPTGSKSCNIQKVTTGSGPNTGTYYKGVSASLGGCVSSENPPYDDGGTGDAKDGCIYSDGVNYCAANKAKHCSTTQGSEICDDGCIGVGNELYCDTSKHPDVGEGDSNYFDDKGTCSVISASSSRGFCEDNDGVWDETTDYQETSCPAGAGTCSVAVAGLCASCFDAGGNWTPDPSALLSDEAKVGIENQALAKTGNNKLTQIEHGQRKTAEATQSTIKSGNAKVVAAIESLGQKLTEEKEKESFTTTTSTTDKSKINSLFDATATATLSAEIETLKTDITTSINSIRAEASSMMSITVPSTTGYEARNLTLTQGTFDMSLGRFSDFFKALAMPVMLICSILAGFILLGGKN